MNKILINKGPVTRLGVSLALVAIVTIIVIIALPRPSSFVTFSASDVKVEVSLTRTSNADHILILTARYTPLRSGFHLYSTDLPLDGLDGMGRPTRLDLISDLMATGSLTVDQPIIMQHIDGLTEIFPIYPDGAVTLQLPVTAINGTHTGTVKVSYMACSSSFGCLPPTEKILTVAIPS